MLDEQDRTRLAERVRDELNIGVVFGSGGICAFSHSLYIEDVRKIVEMYEAAVEAKEASDSQGNGGAA